MHIFISTIYFYWKYIIKQNVRENEKHRNVVILVKFNPKTINLIGNVPGIFSCIVSFPCNIFCIQFIQKKHDIILKMEKCHISICHKMGSVPNKTPVPNRPTSSHCRYTAENSVYCNQENNETIPRGAAVKDPSPPGN